MNISNEEILNKLKESIDKSVGLSLISFVNQPNRNKRIYAEKVINEINNKLENIDYPIMIEQANGNRILLSEARLIYSPELSTEKFLSFSLVGKSVEDKIVEILFDKNGKDIKL